MKIREILELIDDEIEYQEKSLRGNFELDKPIKWRITGMKELKDKILEKIEQRLEENERRRYLQKIF